MRWLMLSVLLAGCSHVSHSDTRQRIKERESLDSVAVSSVESRTESGPVDRVVVVEEFAPGVGGDHPAELPAPTGSNPVPGPRPGALVRRTVTTEHRGAVVATIEAHATSTAQAEGRRETVVDDLRETETRVGTSPLIWLLVVALAALAVLLWWRTR